jgi:ribosome-associated protein
MEWDIIGPEIRFRTSRSSGAGGQHVNKTETRVEAIFEVNASIGLTEEEKVIILERLSTRINTNGELVVVSQKSRSQLDNKEIALERLQALLQKALTPVKKRRKTKIPKEVKEARLQSKKRNAEKKEARKKPPL